MCIGVSVRPSLELLQLEQRTEEKAPSEPWLLRKHFISRGCKLQQVLQDARSGAATPNFWSSVKDHLGKDPPFSFSTPLAIYFIGEPSFVASLARLLPQDFPDDLRPKEKEGPVDILRGRKWGDTEGGFLTTAISRLFAFRLYSVPCYNARRRIR